MAKDENMLLRVSQEEKEAFNRAAEIAGLTLSAWCRQHLRKASVKELGAVNEKPNFTKL
jgi:uncharacterized protein (DUF1778 family)